MDSLPADSVISVEVSQDMWNYVPLEVTSRLNHHN